MTEVQTTDPDGTATSKGTGLPFSLVLGLLVGMALFATTQPALMDIDIYWHVRAGRELLEGTSPRDVGAGWSFAPNPDTWVTTQWLSEIMFAGLHSLWGWSALIAFRTVTAGLVLLILARTTLATRPLPLAAFPFLIAGASAITVSQERPQQVTLIGAALLGAVLLAGLLGRLPRWWVVLPLTMLWANLHGGWVLVPAVLGLVTVGRALDHGLRDPTARRALVLTVGSCVAGSLSPAGPEGLWAVVRFSDATGVIQEWMPTTPMKDLGYLTVAMLVIIGISWARPGRVPRSEALATLALLLFAWLAWRYVAPALLILAPLVATRLVESFPGVGLRPEPRWSAPVGITLAVLLPLIGLVMIVGREPLPVKSYPVGLAHQVADLPTGQRVLNDYNVAGLVLAFAGPDARVGIDGRADRYGAQYIKDYSDLTSLTGDWEPLLGQLDPTSALLEEDSPLVHYLTVDLGWRKIGTESGYVLLVAPPGSAS